MMVYSFRIYEDYFRPSIQNQSHLTISLMPNTPTQNLILTLYLNIFKLTTFINDRKFNR